MSKAMWLVLLLMGPLVVVYDAVAEARSYNLLGRSSADGYAVNLEESDGRWLSQKKILKLGASAPDYPPLELIRNGHDYEGLTADYAALLAQLLGVKIGVLNYASRYEAIQALKSGEIDLLGTANGFEAADSELVMSQAYAGDQPTLITRSGDSQNLSSNLAGKQVAMLYHYLPPEQVKAFYPQATLQLYPSTLSAIGAVAFGRADVYLGDSISANYLINKNYLNNVQLADFSRMEVNSFSFALSRNNPRLLRIVNDALEKIPAGERAAILNRWGAGGTNMPGQHRLQFSVSEQQWLDRHPQIKIVVSENLLPLSYFDDHGKFVGITADVLAKIGLRTGLRFDVQRGGLMNELVDQVSTGQVDLLASFVATESGDGKLRFTRPYLSSPFVLVTQSKSDSPSTLDEMEGMKLAITRDSAIREFIVEGFPNINIVEAVDGPKTMELIASGKVDGAVTTLIGARSMTSRLYRDQLQITSTVGLVPAQIAFATGEGASELYSILDKALLSIPPDEMDELTSRWRNELIIDDSYWLRHRTSIIQGFFVAATLLLITFGWAIYLRRLISRRKEAEQTLNDQMEFMRVLVDGTPHPIYVRDREARLVSCNSVYLDVFGINRDAVMGKRVLDGILIDPAEAKGYHDDYLYVMSNGVPVIRDRQLTMPQGKLTIYHWMLPYRDRAGEVAGMIAGWIDVSERYRLLEELQEAKETADDASRAKTTFLATMSHEIRTPMNALIGMLELAMRKADQGILDRFAIEVASGAAQDLLGLIGDILDIARIESGRLSLTPERANLLPLIESVVRVFDGLARQKHLSLILDIDKNANQDVLIDPLRFKQILSNLLSNAIKFTPHGAVRLSVQACTHPSAESLSVHILVEDSGIGISTEDQERLFSPFAQASNNTESARSGSGLGLVISRTLCEMMEGRLELISTLGKGTKIELSFELPILQSLDTDQLEVEPTVSRHSSPLNVLVVDDYPANRLLLAQQLSYLGHHVSDAQDGVQGLLVWRSARFDVIITDCNMPNMNGYEFARTVRDEEASAGTAPCLILGFTANAQLYEIERCLEAGMDDCLFKPVGLKDLDARMSSIKSNTTILLEESFADETQLDFDLTSLEQLTGGDQVSINALLHDLAVCNRDDFIRLSDLFEKRDLIGLAGLAHRIKGGARIIKARSLIAACGALETACNADKSDQAVKQSVLALSQVMTQLAKSLDTYL